MGGGGLLSGLPLKFSGKTKAKPNVKTPNPESSMWLSFNKSLLRDFIKGEGPCHCAQGHFRKIWEEMELRLKTGGRQGEDMEKQRMGPEVKLECRRQWQATLKSAA